MKVLAELVILNLIFFKVAFSLGFAAPNRVNGQGLPYNFPFVPNPFTTPVGVFPTFAPAPPIDPRINSLQNNRLINFQAPVLSNDRLNSMLNVMLSARDLTTQNAPTVASVVSR